MAIDARSNVVSRILGLKRGCTLEGNLSWRAATAVGQAHTIAETGCCLRDQVP
jgi:hypothetical protein